jgi:BASS family bile acid:Na+ symporter
VSDVVTNLFPVWTVLGAAVGLLSPDTFSSISTKYFTAMLAALMLSMGITLTLKDFQDCLSKPVPVAINFICCYIMMPALAFAIGSLMGLNSALMAGLVLVGSINGGQASNLCTYIAKGDVALSVVMTTSTTIGCIFMTPLIAKLVLGTIVPVDPIGIAISTIQVVLLPVIIGCAQLLAPTSAHPLPLALTLALRAASLLTPLHPVPAARLSLSARWLASEQRSCLSARPWRSARRTF